MKQTAIQQNIARLEKKIYELQEKDDRNFSDKHAGIIFYLNEELTENKNLLEVEKEQLKRAFMDGDDCDIPSPFKDVEDWFTNTYEQ